MICGRSIGVADTNDDGFDDVGVRAAWLGDDVFVIYGPIASDMDLIDADVISRDRTARTPDTVPTSATSRATASAAVIGAHAEAGNRGVVYVVNGRARALRPRD
jgi:hypothetical protein